MTWGKNLSHNLHEDQSENQATLKKSNCLGQAYMKVENSLQGFFHNKLFTKQKTNFLSQLFA